MCQACSLLSAGRWHGANLTLIACLLARTTTDPSSHAGSCQQTLLAALFADGDTYILFDCPGQVELFTLHDNLRGIITGLTDRLHYR